MNVDVIVDNIKDKNKMTDNKTNKELKPKSTVIISENVGSESVPNAATIHSPFRKDNSKTNTNGMSPEKASIDSVRSNTSAFKVDKYVPKKYRTRCGAVNRESTFKLVRLDWDELNSCGAYSRFTIISICLIIIVINILDMNSEETKENKLVNKVISNKTLIKPISKAIENNSKYYLTIICAISIFVETILLLSYGYHIVENFYRFPWLLIESIYETIFAIHFYLLSIWVAFYGFWFFIVAIIGLIVAVIYTVWAAIKIKNYFKGYNPQRRTDDPDGNTLRRESPNIKFSDPKEDEFRKNLLKENEFNVTAKEDNIQ